MVLTHGLRCRPFSTAFFASSPAPIMTDGLDVFVHDVIAAIVTAPWSMTNSVPSPSVTLVGVDGRPLRAGGTDGISARWSPFVVLGESEAGKDSATDSSTASWTDDV